MKVFLGWSGGTSHRVALTLHGWLPNVIQAIKPYISSEDIAKGARWANEIANELESSKYGIISVTKENVSSPWINFEAGALSREIEKSFVTPFLFDLRPAEVQGPLAQFQHTIWVKEDVLKLLSTINSKQEPQLQLAKDSLGAAFEVWWPRLNDELEKLKNDVTSASSKPAPPKPDQGEIMEELLETTRAMQREMWSAQNRDRAERDQQLVAQDNLFHKMGEVISSLRIRLDELDRDLHPIPKMTALRGLFAANHSESSEPDVDLAGRIKKLEIHIDNIKQTEKELSIRMESPDKGKS